MISKDINGNEYEVTSADLGWRPSAYGIVIDDAKILLIKENGKYHLPGGGLELGEDPRETVIREVEEESGIVVGNPKLIEMNSTFFTWENLESPKTFTHVQSLLLYYSCDLEGGVLGDTKLDEYERLTDTAPEWVEISKLDEIIVGTTVDWRPLIKQFLGFGLKSRH